MLLVDRAEGEEEEGVGEEDALPNILQVTKYESSIDIKTTGNDIFCILMGLKANAATEV